MDLRQKKTLAAIRTAFLELLGKKPLEKITVKELAEKAQISKATFYLHYQDIYDLAERLQAEVIGEIYQSIAHPDLVLTDQPGAGVEKAYFPEPSGTKRRHPLPGASYLSGLWRILYLPPAGRAGRRGRDCRRDRGDRQNPVRSGANASHAGLRWW